MRLGIGELKLRKKGLLPEMQLLVEIHFLEQSNFTLDTSHSSS